MGDVVKLRKMRRSRPRRAGSDKAAKLVKPLGTQPKKSKRAEQEQAAQTKRYSTGALSMPILSEMMRAPTTAQPASGGNPLLESGVLAFRRKKSGKPLVLLISKKRSKRWGIPKGRLEPDLSFAENAAKEAFEEAGVIGDISPTSIGMFRGSKRTANPRMQQTIEVWVYLLEVTETLPDWPEKQKRKTRWVSCEVAARQLREPVLTVLCHRLAQS